MSSNAVKASFDKKLGQSRLCKVLQDQKLDSGKERRT